MENEKVRYFLSKIAKDRELISYGELCKAQYNNLDFDLQKDKTQLFKSLTEISEYEHSQGRPLLSIVVVKEETKMPGAGFFKMAAKLGKYRGDESEGHYEKFFKEELEETYKYWEKFSLNIRGED